MTLPSGVLCSLSTSSCVYWIGSADFNSFSLLVSFAAVLVGFLLVDLFVGGLESRRCRCPFCESSARGLSSLGVGVHEALSLANMLKSTWRLEAQVSAFNDSLFSWGVRIKFHRDEEEHGWPLETIKW